MVFPKKWPKNHPKILLHFLIHIDVLLYFYISDSGAVLDHSVNLLLSSGCIRMKDGRIEIARVEEETRLRYKDGTLIIIIIIN